MEYIKLLMDELKLAFPSFEERKEQMTMMENVYHSMKNNEKIAVHAPTGTGKTYGYIIPYLAMKLENPTFKAVFATFTLNLQEQLAEDFISCLKLFEAVAQKKKIGIKPIQFVNLKGTKNYFCEKRFSENTNFSDKVKERLQTVIDLTTKRDKQEMGSQFPKRWNDVHVEGCAKKECPFYQRCTYFRDYEKVSRADVVITNHSLFYTRYFFVDQWDSFKFFVFDEAHKTEKVILDTYTFPLSKSIVFDWMEEGLKIAQKFQVPEEESEQWLHDYYHSHEAIENFNTLLTNIQYSVGKQSFKLTETPYSQRDVQLVIYHLIQWLKSMYQDWKTLFTPKQRDSSQFKELLSNWGKKIANLQEFAMFSNTPTREGEIWFEYNKQQEEVTMKITPSSFSQVDLNFKKGTLYTSGTIAQEDSCNAFAERMNIELERDIVLPSPFLLSEQTMVHVSKDINPKDGDIEKLENEIYDLCAIGHQKTFILFTSRKSMWDMFKRLQPRLKEMNTYKDQPLELFIQQEDNNKEVIASFRNPHVRSILFGTLSYFEGVDLKGEALSQIILTKLPYSVPNHPIQEILDKNQGYSTWEAMVRYEQAFGRLVRSAYDYGTFHILDNRISYLTHFLAFFQHEQITITDDKEEVRRFFSQQG